MSEDEKLADAFTAWYFGAFPDSVRTEAHCRTVAAAWIPHQLLRIEELEKVADALVAIMPNLEMSYAIKTAQYNKLELLLKAAGYLGEGNE
jgi:hypothetical protein